MAEVALKSYATRDCVTAEMENLSRDNSAQNFGM